MKNKNFLQIHAKVSKKCAFTSFVCLVNWLLLLWSNDAIDSYDFRCVVLCVLFHCEWIHCCCIMFQCCFQRKNGGKQKEPRKYTIRQITVQCDSYGSMIFGWISLPRYTPLKWLHIKFLFQFTEFFIFTMFIWMFCQFADRIYRFCMKMFISFVRSIAEYTLQQQTHVQWFSIRMCWILFHVLVFVLSCQIYRIKQ